jgi:hypothetical protein
MQKLQKLFVRSVIEVYSNHGNQFFLVITITAGIKEGAVRVGVSALSGYGDYQTRYNTTCL